MAGRMCSKKQRDARLSASIRQRPKQWAMSSTRIVYASRSNAAEGTLDALSRIYARALECYAENERKGGPETAPDDATKSTEDSARNG